MTQPALVGRLPVAARTPDMRALLAQGQLQIEIRNAVSLAPSARPRRVRSS